MWATNILEKSEGGGMRVSVDGAQQLNKKKKQKKKQGVR